jgi:hypothetical protein
MPPARHLLNRAGLPLPDRINFSDYIPPVGPITVEIRTDKKPERIVLAPGEADLKWEWKDGVTRVEAPKIGVHEVLVVHEAQDLRASDDPTIRAPDREPSLGAPRAGQPRIQSSTRSRGIPAK